MAEESIPSLMLGPARCDDISRDTLVARLLAPAAGGEPELYFNLNAHALNLVLADPALAPVFNAATVTFCDGFGVHLLARLFLGVRMRHRMTPPDFVDEVYRGLAATGRRVFFLGDEAATVAEYAKRIEAAHPGVVAGWHDGFFDAHSGSDAPLRAIREAAPHVVLIGMGMPRQERWAVAHRHELACARVMSVGALFAWGTSGRRRGPRWATDHGLEWLCRLVTEPGRVWRRYVIGLPQVAWRLYRYRRRHE